jgi:tetratricopeptide (TPR) repeat protein
LLEGGDFGVGVVGALLDRPVETAEAALEQLTDEHLLDSPDSGRYRFHDLVRLFAREQAEAEEPAAERLAAHDRSLRFYLALAQRADRLLRPGKAAGDQHGGREGSGLAPRDHGEALDWLDREYVNLVAAIHQAARIPDIPAAIPGQLAYALFTYFTLRTHLLDWQQVSRRALEAARRDGDPLSQGQAYNALGCIAQRRDEHDQAVRYFEQSLRMRRLAGDRQGEAGTLCNLGVTRRWQGRHDEAAANYRQSLAIARELGDRLAEGQILNSLGNVHREQGLHAEALRLHAEALVICEEIDDRPGQSHTLYSLGQTSRELGRDREAVGYFQRDLRLSRELGDLHGCAETLRELGLALDAIGERSQATACWTEALTILERLDAADAQGDVAEEARTVRALLDGGGDPA